MYCIYIFNRSHAKFKIQTHFIQISLVCALQDKNSGFLSSSINTHEFCYFHMIFKKIFCNSTFLCEFMYGRITDVPSFKTFQVMKAYLKKCEWRLLENIARRRALLSLVGY